MLGEGYYDTPTVRAKATRKRVLYGEQGDGARWRLTLMDPCPYCGWTHTHIGGDGESPTGGYRIPPCTVFGTYRLVVAQVDEGDKQPRWQDSGQQGTRETEGMEGNDETIR